MQLKTGTIGLYIFGLTAIVVACAIPAVAWVSPLAIVVVLPICAILLWRSTKNPFGDLGFRASNGWLRYVGFGLLLGAAIPILFLVVQALGGWIEVSPLGSHAGNVILPIIEVLLRMILIVAIEEFVFRGFFLQSLTPNTGLWPAMVLSSILWGASHLPSMIANGLSAPRILTGLATFLVWGITLCLCRLIANRTLWLPYGLHLGVNLAFSIPGLFLAVQPAGPEWWIGQSPWMPESGIIGILGWMVVAFALFLVWRRFTRNNAAAKAEIETP